MSKNVLLISPQTIKDRTGVHKNMDDSLIAPEIKIVQDTELVPALGTKFFEHLQAAFKAGTLSAEETALLDDYITDVLVQFTLMALPMSSSYQFYTKGMLRRNGDNSELPSMSDMVDLSNYYKNRGEFYRERLIRYLGVHRGDFPEYEACGCDNDIAPAASGYTAPMYLGDD